MNALPTCATCRFMAEPRGIDFYDDDVERTTDHRSCVRIIHGNGDAKYEGYERVAPEPAIVTDGSGYAARLLVLPTFGCNLHEDRTTSARRVTVELSEAEKAQRRLDPAAYAEQVIVNEAWYNCRVHGTIHHPLGPDTETPCPQCAADDRRAGEEPDHG